MATYTQGNQPYLPNWQPFTPDYKFLSDVLDTKTNRYNTNYKELNDLYGKVVYSELSRQDTNEMRDQFTNTLGKQLELVSGMDLSVAQNVDYAKKLFKPFYDEKIIVKDMLYTKKYRDDMQYANQLQQSPDQQMRELYWTTGVEALNYQMQDFKNASADEALGMSLPQYVADADLEQKALDYLKKQGFDVTMDSISPDGAFIVKDRNGNLITEQAYRMASRALLDDPIVQQAYYTDAYVKSRKFADSGIQTGNFKSVSEGQNAWASEVINVYEKNLAIRSLNEKADLSKLQDINVNWENYIKNYGIIPGSTEEQELNVVQDELTSKLMAYQQTQSILQNAGTMDTKTTKGLLNKAYSLIMGYNMQDDLSAGVVAFSNINKSRELKVNDYYKQKLDHQHDFAKIQQQHTNAMTEEAQKQRNRIDLEKLKGTIGGSDFINSILGGGMDASGAVYNEMGTESSAIDTETGLAIDPKKYDYVNGQQNKILNYHQDALNENIQFGLEALEKFYPSKNGNNQYSLNFENTGITTTKVGSLPELRQYLQDPRNKTIAEGFIYKMHALMKDPDLAVKTNPNFVKENSGANYQELQTRFDVSMGRLTAVDNIQTQFMGTVSDNFDKAIQTDLTSETKSVREDIAAGALKIIQPSQNGTSRIISEQEFIADFIQKARSKGPQNNKYYYYASPAAYTRASIGTLPPGGVSAQDLAMSSSRRPKTDGFIFNENLAVANAVKSYKRQKDIMNATLSGVLNTEAEKGGKGRIFQSFDAGSFMRGVPKDQMTAADALKNPSYPSFFDPTTIGKDPLSQRNFAFLVGQVKKTPSQDLTFYAGDIGKDDVRTESSNAKAKQVFDQWLLSVSSFSNAKASKTNIPKANITYNPVYGANDEDNLGKTKAAYVITFDTDWLQSLQGSANKPGLIGAIELESVKTITISFPQDKDVSDRSFKDFNFSNVIYDVEYSPEKQYVKNIDSGGRVRVYKNAKDELILETQPTIYNIKTGNMEPLQVQTFPIGQIASGSPIEQIDFIVQQKINQLNIIAQNNNKNQLANKKSKQ
jgi:hypothetical protein